MICADTSFLISLYGTDVHTAAAEQRFTGAGQTLVIHAFGEFEFENALSNLVFQRRITAEKRLEWLANYTADKRANILLYAHIPEEYVLDRAVLLSKKHTLTGGHRCYDLLIVAAALEAGATEFWSFDGRQRALAAAEGMKVGP